MGKKKKRQPNRNKIQNGVVLIMLHIVIWQGNKFGGKIYSQSDSEPKKQVIKKEDEK